jgi:hypothetical protein
MTVPLHPEGRNLESLATIGAFREQTELMAIASKSLVTPGKTTPNLRKNFPMKNDS